MPISARLSISPRRRPKRWPLIACLLLCLWPAAAAGALDLVLVVDNSGSMRRAGPAPPLTDVVGTVLDAMPADSRTALVVFDQTARLVQPFEPIDSARDRMRVLAHLSAVDRRGQWSDTATAVERALYELTLHRRPDTPAAIVMITDGIIDTGADSSDRQRRHWLETDLVGACRRYAIKLVTLTPTPRADFSLLQHLAWQTDGAYFRVADAGTLATAAQKLRALLAPPPPPPEPSPPVSPPTVRQPPQDTSEPAPAAPPPAPEREPAPPPPGLTGPGAWGVGLGLLAVAALVLLGMRVRRRQRPVRRPAATGGGAMPRAELHDLDQVTHSRKFILAQATVTLGRDPACDITIDKKTVSGLHAVIEYRDGAFFIEDQRSQNQTRLNGLVVPPYETRRLKSGDEIALHTWRFHFVRPDRVATGDTVVDFKAPAPLSVSPSSPPAQPQAMLVDTENITGRKTIRLEKARTQIGRGPANDIAIERTAVSGAHAVVEYHNGTFYLIDQRSANGTRLNAAAMPPFAPQPLKSGDDIRFDTHRFIFLIEGQEPSGETDPSAWQAPAAGTDPPPDV